MAKLLSSITLGRSLCIQRGSAVALHESAYDPHTWMPAHAHASASLSLVIAGEQLDTVDGVASLCRGLTVIAKPSGVVHETETGATGCRSVTVEVPSRMERMLRTRFGLFDRVYHLDDQRIGHAIFRLWGATRETDDQARLDALWMTAAQEIASAFVAGAERRPPGGSGTRVADGMMLIERGLGPCEVAAQLRVHPVHLCRLMRGETGRSTASNVRRVRVRRALDRLVTGRNSLAAIAAETGFADQSHMTREFTRELGVTPGGIRRAAHRSDV